MTSPGHHPTRHDPTCRAFDCLSRSPVRDGIGSWLERDLVVHVATLTTGAHRHGLACLRTGGAKIAAARLGAEVAAATAAGPVEHLELRIEALQHDLGRVAVLSVL